jgi:L-asparaginase/Glu-tRNA(Gln) amidotransferase subunit D
VKVTAAISDPLDVETVTASQDVEVDVKTYEVDTTSGDVTMTFDLATITYTEGQVWRFKKTQTANKVIITATGGTIDGATNLTFKTKLSSFSVQYDGGTNFIII